MSYQPVQHPRRFLMNRSNCPWASMASSSACVSGFGGGGGGGTVRSSTGGGFEPTCPRSEELRFFRSSTGGGFEPTSPRSVFPLLDLGHVAFAAVSCIGTDYRFQVEQVLRDLNK
jgi:hypothetical protein